MYLSKSLAKFPRYIETVEKGFEEFIDEATLTFIQREAVQKA
jgi:hypothetical protein